MQKNRGNKKGTKYKGKSFLDINQNEQKHKPQRGQNKQYTTKWESDKRHVCFQSKAIYNQTKSKSKLDKGHAFFQFFSPMQYT